MSKIYIVTYIAANGSMQVRACNSPESAIKFAKLHTNGNYFITPQEIYSE